MITQTQDRRRADDCNPLVVVGLFTVYGACVGFLAGYLVRAWWG